MGKKASIVAKSLKMTRQSVVTLLFAPLVALAALFGMVIIAIGQSIKSAETLLGVFGLSITLGGDLVYDFGVSQLPDFFY